jgi:hypothetical protein
MIYVEHNPSNDHTKYGTQSVLSLFRNFPSHQYRTDIPSSGKSLKSRKPDTTKKKGTATLEIPWLTKSCTHQINEPDIDADNSLEYECRYTTRIAQTIESLAIFLLVYSDIFTPAIYLDSIAPCLNYAPRPWGMQPNIPLPNGYRLF